MTLRSVLLGAAVVLFLGAAFNLPLGTIPLVPVGLVCFALSFFPQGAPRG